ncbi:MAG: glycosyltransferase family 4 protein [Opitutaceae bacterium]
MAGRLKVAFDVAQTCVERAGCSWYADSLAGALAEEAKVDLQLLHHFGSWCNTSTENGTRIEGVPSPLQGMGEDDARRFWKKVETEGFPGGADVVHSNCFDAPAIPGSKLVFTIYDTSFWAHPAFATDATRIVCQRGVLDALDRAAGLVFISGASRDDFEEALPGWLEQSRRPHEILHGASRFPDAIRAESTTDAPWLCIGSIEPRKNHATLLRAYVEYRKSVSEPRRLIIAGSRGWNSEPVHERMAALGPERGVEYVGYVSEDRIRRFYMESFCLICPSWYEGFGLPVVEAFAFGLPVICSDIPSLREVGGPAPRYFPVSDAAALASVMKQMHLQNDIMKDASRLSAARHNLFSWQNTARTAFAFYKKLTESPRVAS